MIEPPVALAFTMKLLKEAGDELGATLKAVQPELFETTSPASLATAIETKLVPAFDAFLASADRTNAFVDREIALGKFAPDPVLAPLRAKLVEHRTARDALATLAVRARAGDLAMQQLWQLLAAALLPIADV